MDIAPLPLERLLRWANWAYVLAVAIAAIASFAIYQLSVRVTAAKDRELQDYQTQSTVKITAAEAEAAEARRIAETERLARAELESQVASAEARAAEANAAAAQAQLELAKLQQPRTVSPEDQEKIVATLKQFAGQNFSFTVFGDPESLALVRVLDAMLKSAGWLRVASQIGVIVVEVAGNTAGTSIASGVTASVGPDNPDAEAALVTLCHALTGAGIPCKANRSEELREKRPKAIAIRVGKKP